MEVGEKSPIRRRRNRGKKISRRSFLKRAGQGLLGATAAGALGAIGYKIAKEGGLPSEEDYRWGQGKLYGKELTGETKELTLEVSDISWPILRKEPNPSGLENYLEPQTRTSGVEVYGASYPSATSYGKVTSEADPQHTYGIWVKLEEDLPIYKQTDEGQYLPQFDENGYYKKAKGFVSKNFVTYES